MAKCRDTATKRWRGHFRLPAKLMWYFTKLPAEVPLEALTRFDTTATGEENMRKTGLASASFALAVTISSLLFAQPAPMPPPAPLMPPSLPPSHVVNLMTNEGSAVFGAQWRVGDVKIVEVPAAINKDRYKTAYQFEPRAMATDFD